MVRRLKREDEKGALEGLPLYLIILVVIAGVGTAIIAGWMMSAQSTELGSIEIDDEDKIIGEGSGSTVEITAYDRDNNPLEGATVTLEGCEIQETGITEEDGTYSTERLYPNLPQGESTGIIEVEVRYTGETTTVRTAEIIVEA